MTGFTAHWSNREPAKVTITDATGSVADSITLPLPVRQPSALMLSETEWSLYPGQSWDEDPPGQWTVPVFSLQHLTNQPHPTHGTRADEPPTGQPAPEGNP